MKSFEYVESMTDKCAQAIIDFHDAMRMADRAETEVMILTEMGASWCYITSAEDDLYDASTVAAEAKIKMYLACLPVSS